LQVISLLSFVVLGIQIVYLLALLRAFLQKRKAIKTTVQPVSVIVCAHDEEENLKELIPILLRQNHPAFEVIIVEDRSNDGTYDYLLEATQHDNRLKMVRVTNKPEAMNGKKFGLTLGIKAAKYDWVLLTDADCRPATENWIARMSEHFTPNTEIVVGYSPYQKLPGLLNSFIRFETLLNAVQFLGFGLLGKPYMGVGRNLAYRKSLFLDNKGFNKHLTVTGGDDDLFVNQHATKANVNLAFGLETVTFSAPKTTVRDFYYQKIRHLSVGKLYRIETKLLLGFFMLSLVSTWLFVFPSLFFAPQAYVLLSLLACRWVLLTILFRVASKRVGVDFEVWKTPFLDFIYAFYYLVAGWFALVAKNVQWKK
jgi:glycosyltransferase involved in cell wall biosynthesis